MATICCMLDNRAQVDEIDKKDYQKFLMGGHIGKTSLCKGCLDHAYKKEKCRGGGIDRSRGAKEDLARQTSGQELTTS